MLGRRIILAIAISVLATVALGVSAYLTWTIWQSSAVAGCGAAGATLDCNDVLTSRWSKWLGLPVSLFGILIYAGILGLSWPAASRAGGVAKATLFSLVLLAVGAGVWFIGIQAVQLQSFCMYCLTVHACGLIIGVLTLLLLLDRSDSSDQDQMRTLLGVAVDPTEDFDEVPLGLGTTSLIGALSVSALGLAILMGGQLLFEPAETMAMEEIELDPIASQTSEVPKTEVESATIAIDPPAESEQPVVSIDVPLTSTVTDDADHSWLESDRTSVKGELTLGEQPPATTFNNAASLITSIPESYYFKALAEPIDLTAMPVLGNADAKFVVLEMMDYTCKHCRHIHPHLLAAKERYGDQFAVAVHHVPLSKKCNPHLIVPKDYPGKQYACDYAQLAIGVWNLAPEKFPEFHNWLLEGEKPPSSTKARQRALKLVGDAVLLDKKVKADIKRRLAKQADEFKRLDSGLPILLFTNAALRGVPDTSERLFEYLETKIGIKPL